jgi:hypothetical protein
MKTKLLLIAGLALAISAPLARAQEEGERREYQGERGGGAPPPVADPKVALCAAIETNYNNCLKHQHDGCPAWVIELKANHCF